ncbi:MAG: hypothetical protein LBN39_04745 [Planctomycetaceae bacterium]|jgi:hypothetical protein|nr:hypothetical protein [Planctomycetaceae bacterium]
MFTKVRNYLFTFAAAVFAFLQPVLLFAQEAAKEEPKDPDWVLSYFLILLFLGLAITVLLRSAKRSDTAFSVEELAAQKEEAMKKMMGH